MGVEVGVTQHGSIMFPDVGLRKIRLGGRKKLKLKYLTPRAPQEPSPLAGPTRLFHFNLLYTIKATLLYKRRLMSVGFWVVSPGVTEHLSGTVEY